MMAARYGFGRKAEAAPERDDMGMSLLDMGPQATAPFNPGVRNG